MTQTTKAENPYDPRFQYLDWLTFEHAPKCKKCGVDAYVEHYSASRKTIYTMCPKCGQGQNIVLKD